MKKNALLTLPDNGPAVASLSSETSSHDFVELKQMIKKRGLLEKQPVYYGYRILLLTALLVLSVALLFSVHVFWLQLLNAVFMAFVFTQIGLLSHEAGHRQMFNRSWKHDMVALLGGNLFIGMSYGWWLDKHNTHHSHPNQLDMDPDIEIPFLEFTGMEDVSQISKFRQFLVKHQAFIFLPALMTVSASLQINSVRFLLRNKAKYQAAEWALMIAHFVLYFGAILYNMNWWQAIIFIMINQAATGFYLGSIFAPNHKGMPVVEKESKIGFLHRQVMTSRNIYGNPVVDFIYGGLNYQIEHHLFPSMPRNKLKEARHMIKLFCEEHEIPYHETYPLQSLKEILVHLHQIGAPLRGAA
ncbi:delta fatty acid desaturase [Dictyobacter alpinus]|uniref:Delta fatty acid desaturase n=1 Tax=Dictyobacter alpinus TaxID=2014873 RepID=A0A402BGX4_9CHLR|nr:acyl-CoA desaturase [Dictyobacter alpinus]GCE30623.1 delta fatty acid desaturase [Dictyobacter alpinus]